MFFYFFIFRFFNGRPRSKSVSEITKRIFTKIVKAGRAIEGLDMSSIYLAIAQGTLPCQPIKVAKSAFFVDQS